MMTKSEYLLVMNSDTKITIIISKAEYLLVMDSDTKITIIITKAEYLISSEAHKILSFYDYAYDAP